MESLIQTVGRLEEEAKQAMEEQSVGSKQVIEALNQINTITSKVRDRSSNIMDFSKTVEAEVDKVVDYSKKENIRGVTSSLRYCKVEND